MPTDENDSKPDSISNVVENSHEHKSVGPGLFTAICMIQCPICFHHRLSWNACIGDDPLCHLCIAPDDTSTPKLVTRSGGEIVGHLE